MAAYPDTFKKRVAVWLTPLQLAIAAGVYSGVSAEVSEAVVALLAGSHPDVVPNTQHHIGHAPNAFETGRPLHRLITQHHLAFAIEAGHLCTAAVTAAILKACPESILLPANTNTSNSGGSNACQPLHLAMLKSCGADVISCLLHAIPEDKVAEMKAPSVYMGWDAMMFAWFGETVSPLPSILRIYEWHPEAVDQQGTPPEEFYSKRIGNVWSHLHAAAAIGAPLGHLHWLFSVAPALASTVCCTSASVITYSTHPRCILPLHCALFTRPSAVKDRAYVSALMQYNTAAAGTLLRYARSCRSPLPDWPAQHILHAAIKNRYPLEILELLLPSIQKGASSNGLFKLMLTSRIPSDPATGYSRLHLLQRIAASCMTRFECGVLQDAVSAAHTTEDMLADVIAWLVSTKPEMLHEEGAPSKTITDHCSSSCSPLARSSPRISSEFVCAIRY